MNRRIVALALVATLLHGCATVSDYPASWPKVASGSQVGDCPDIAGTYGNVGVSASENARQIRLSDLFPIPEESDTVKIVQAPDTIAIASHKAGVESHRLAYASARLGYGPWESWDQRKSNAFMCLRDLLSGRQLTFNHQGNSSSLGGVGIIGGYSAEGVTFRKATDGSLLVRFSKSLGALLVLIPVGKTEEVWYRYARID